MISFCEIGRLSWNLCSIKPHNLLILSYVYRIYGVCGFCSFFFPLFVYLTLSQPNGATFSIRVYHCLSIPSLLLWSSSVPILHSVVIVFTPRSRLSAILSLSDHDRYLGGREICWLTGWAWGNLGWRRTWLWITSSPGRNRTLARSFISPTCYHEASCRAWMLQSVGA